MSGLHAEPVVLASCELGEAPLWDAARERMIWLDIPAQTAHTYDPRTGLHRTAGLPWMVSCIVPAVDGGFVTAGERGVWHTDEDFAPDRFIADLPVVDGTRTNDGGCDPFGRLWVGSADGRADGTRGRLWRVDPDGRVLVVRQGVSMSNGIGWTVDGLRCFHVDTRTHAIDVLTLDASGDVQSVSRFVEVAGMPDGLAVDVDGGVWVAFWDRSAVLRFGAEGVVDEVVEVDGGYVTSCAFGPQGSGTLYSTTASQNERDAPVAAGALFAIDVGVDGVPVGSFGSEHRT